MEKISWTNGVNTEKVLLRVQKERNIIRSIKRRNATYIGHTLRR
jgi:hypothetical protein